MSSGWGIRTLSASHPAYNPYSYQNGSVWPHDNGLIAQGFRRYGYAAETGQIANDVCGAGRFFMLNQLPELYAGLHRDAANFPVQYPGANVPQDRSSRCCRRSLACSPMRRTRCSMSTLYCRRGSAM
ncbi:MGH1-like glycoside hydrolase domain-containing protein [Paraburkholderia fungorum]|uniref:MGH1-like glycoside hydrolase domain-containing protein n=1 Tax=Paraburkholderia fungorum TaxID=134537 RepID=UPI0038BC1B21